MNKLTRSSKKSKSIHYVSNEDFYSSLVEYLLKCSKLKQEYVEKYRDKLEFYAKDKFKPKEPGTIPLYEHPRIPEKIGLAIFQIARNLVKAPNFYGYSYKEEFISDAYYDCLLRLHSFDIKKSRYIISSIDPDEDSELKLKPFTKPDLLLDFVKTQLDITNPEQLSKLKSELEDKVYQFKAEYILGNRYTIKQTKNPFSYFTQISYFANVRRIKHETKQSKGKEELIRNSGILTSMMSETQYLDDGTYDSSYMSFLQETIDVVKTDAEKDSEGRKLIKKTTKHHQEKMRHIEDEKKLDENRETWKTELEDVRTTPITDFFSIDPSIPDHE